MTHLTGYGVKLWFSFQVAFSVIFQWQEPLLTKENGITETIWDSEFDWNVKNFNQFDKEIKEDFYLRLQNT